MSFRESVDKKFAFDPKLKPFALQFSPKEIKNLDMKQFEMCMLHRL